MIVINFNKFNKINLTKNDLKIISLITIPAFVEMLLSQLFSMVDIIMLGKTSISSIAIAAVGFTNNPVNLMIGVIQAFCIGTTTAVAWSIGAVNAENAKAVVRQSIIFISIIGIIASAIGVFAAEPIVIFMGAKGEVLPYSIDYLRYIAAGFLFQSVSMCITASLRGVGLTKLPMLYNLIANGLNVFFNYILIYGKLGFPEMGVAGAAIATTLSKVVAFVISLLILFLKDTPIRIKLTEDFRLRISILKRIFDVGITAALEQLSMQVGFIFFTKTVSVLSIPVFAAHQIGLNINGLCWVPSQAFGVAATTLVGQSIGAGNKDKAKKYARFIHMLSLFSSLFIAIIFMLWSENIAGLYSNDPAVIKPAGEVLKLIALGMPGIATQLPISAALRGAKDTRFPLLANICGIWIFRVIAAPIFVHVFQWGIHGAWWTIVLDQTCRAVIVYIRFLKGKWLNKKIIT